LTKKGEQAVFDAGRIIAERQKQMFGELSLKDETAFEKVIDGLDKVLG